MKAYRVEYTQVKEEVKLGKFRKEDHFYKQLSVIVPSKSETYPENFVSTLMTVRFYHTKSRVYCCMWVQDHKNNFHVLGGGYAGGYGYHKASAAFEAAINSAGFTLWGLDKQVSIGGAGDSAINNALIDIARHLGYHTVQILEAYA